MNNTFLPWLAVACFIVYGCVNKEKDRPFDMPHLLFASTGKKSELVKAISWGL